MAFILDDAERGAGGNFLGRGSGGADQVLTGDIRTGAPEATGGSAAGAPSIIPNVAGPNLLALRSQLQSASGTVAAPSSLAQPQSLSVTQFTVAAYNAILPVIYGPYPVVGLLANIYAYGAMFICWVVWGKGPIDSVQARFLNDAPYPAGSGAADYLGTDTQSADSTLGTVAGFTDPLHGIAYSVIQIPQTSMTGTPKFTDFLFGRHLYDPRQDSTNGGSGSQRADDPATWTFVNNAALVACDYFRSIGKTPVWSSIAAAANACETGINRLVFMAMDREQSTASWATTFLTTCNCLLVEQGYLFKLVPDIAGSSVASYSHASGQIIALDGETLSGTAELPTVMEVVYSNASGYPWTEDTVRVERPGVTQGMTPYRKSTVRMPWIADKATAIAEAYQRINKLWHRRQKFRLTLFDEGLQHEPGDIIDVTFPESGYSALLSKVNAVQPNADGWELNCTVESSAAYVYTAVVPDSTSGVLQFLVITDAGTANRFSYWTFSTATRTILSDDVLEYDYMIQGGLYGDEIGGMDILFNDATSARAYGVTDTNVDGINRPAAATRGIARAVWQPRVISLAAVAGKVVTSWQLACENDTPISIILALYRNIRITSGFDPPRQQLWASGNPGANVALVQGGASGSLIAT